MLTSKTNELSPDVLVCGIVNKIDKLHQRITNISSKCENLKIQNKSNIVKKYNSIQNIEIVNSIDTFNSDNIVVINSLFEKFHDFYSNNFDLLSMYFENYLTDLHKNVSTTKESFNKCFNQPDHGQFTLFLSIMNTILSNCEILFSKALEFKLQEETQQIENAKLLSVNDNLDENCYFSNDCVNIEIVDKQYYNDIRKFVNHICSQITYSNPEHTRGRLFELIQLFGKSDVLLVGSENVFINLRKYPGALDMCWEFLNQAVVTQAEIQFAVNIETAVAFAGVIAAVLGHFPDRMNSMVAVLKNRCSFLLQSNDTPDDFDSDEKCIQLKGIARFLAAIAVAEPIRGYNTHPELTPGFLWSLLASVCNEDSYPEFTSEAALGMLEIGGQILKLTYGKQFEKLLLALKKKFANFDNLSSLSLIIEINSIMDSNSLDHKGDFIE